jgi:nucleotide-binding universal stress UspA family protein
MYKSLLVATDGSETAAEAVRVATELAEVFGATLHIASVYRAGQGGKLRVPEMQMAYPEGVDSASVAATQTESIASAARTRGLSAQTHVMTGNVAERIVAIAEEQHVELIVVGNKGMRGLKRVLGSVPNAVAHTAQCAVLIVNTT